MKNLYVSKEFVERIKDEVEFVFEAETGIAGLSFYLVEARALVQRYPERVYATEYNLRADVPANRLGVMGNNLENVYINITHWVPETDESVVYFRGSFRYEHKSGGSNGMEVMDRDGSDRFIGKITI